MFDELWYIWWEWKYWITIGICYWFMLDCQKHKRILLTPVDYYLWGIITMGMAYYFDKMPVG